MTDPSHCTLCRQRAGLPVPPVEIVHDEPRLCEGDCRHCRAVGLREQLAAVTKERDEIKAVVDEFTKDILGRAHVRYTDRVRADAKRRRLRQAAKPIVFVLHERCPFNSIATCLCGKEPFYSPAARRARGEIE